MADRSHPPGGASQRLAGSVERERKFSAWPGFSLPGLDDLVTWARADEGSVHVLDAVYWDTADLRLVRSGVTLRHRTSDGDGGTWTLKLPPLPGAAGAGRSGSAGAGELVRTEFDLPGGPQSPPDVLAHLVVAWARSASLQPVARLQTVRRSVVLRDGGGRALAELADDEVSVLEADRVAARFREVELEVRPGAPATLAELVADRLVAAGAGPADPTPKLARALGPRALAGPDVAPLDAGGPDLPADATVAMVVRAAVGRAVSRLVAHDPVIRLDGGAHGVHQARVSTRRLRSDLRTLHPVLDAAWADGLRADLAHLARALGAVRDTDVLLGRLTADAEALGHDADAGRALLRRLVRERDVARTRLVADLQAPAYAALLDRLVDAARSPRVLPEHADRPAAEVLPLLVQRPWRRLRRDVAALGRHPHPDELHEVRIRAKRARYAAEAAGLLLPAAAAHARALAAVTDALGDHHDAAVAEAWLRSAVDRGVTRQQALAAGLMIAAQRRHGDEAVGRWESAWVRADRRRVRRWLATA